MGAAHRVFCARRVRPFQRLRGGVPERQVGDADLDPGFVRSEVALVGRGRAQDLEGVLPDLPPTAVSICVSFSWNSGRFPVSDLDFFSKLQRLAQSVALEHTLDRVQPLTF